MKFTYLAAIVFTVAALSLPLSAPAFAQAAPFDGQVTKVDAATGKMTIKHGPMKKFDMEDGMTMVYAVKDPALFKAVKPGDKIKFDADRINGQFVVTRIAPAK